MLQSQTYKAQIAFRPKSPNIQHAHPLPVLIPASFSDKKQHSYQKGQNFRRHNGQPDPVHSPDKGQHHNRCNLKHQRAQKRNRCRDHPIIQRCKKGGPPDIDSHHHKCQCIKAESVAGHGEKSRIIARKYPHKRYIEKLSQQSHADPAGTHQNKAFAKQILQLCPAACAIMITYNRRTANGITDKNSLKYKIHVHNDAICRHTVLTCQPHKPDIVQNVYHRHGKIGNHLGRSVHAGKQQNSSLQPCLCQS